MRRSAAVRRGAEETAAANRSWWDAEAGDYYAEHGTFLGDADLTWGPEGWRESELAPARRRSRAGGCSRSAPARARRPAGWPPRAPRWSPPTCRPAWSGRGATSTRRSPPGPAGALRPVRRGRPCPSPTRAFDLVFTAYGAVPFVADSAPPDARGGPGAAARAAGSSSRRPTRSAGPSPTTRAPEGLTRHPVLLRPHALRRGRTRDGEATYVEHHRTLGRPRARDGRRRAWSSSTSSSRSGRSEPRRTGAAGRRCAGGCCPGRRSSSAGAEGSP